ncbi:unnamed protein product, partial [Mesorhabditis belari]|uniref:Uncharacterized protein n=1 Tax=Mesorhabditis belari TaxID=2138241 RepID=A0AAF3EEN4_9BILA
MTREWDRITPAELRPIAENFIKRLKLCSASEPKEWPPYSCDLNPLDYSVWSILKARAACAKPHKSLEALKRSLTKERDRIAPAELRPIAENFIKRLKLCIGAKGGHFEEK